MKNFLTGGQDKSLTDCIQALSRSLENRNSSPELRDLFFKLIDKRDQLPESVSEETTSNFIYCLVEISYADPDEREALKALTALFRYLKTDLNVFTHFKPSRILIRRLKLDKYLINSTSDVMETVLDFAIFLLRYYEAVDYEDFSDLATINAKIKRAELHRVWIDIEEIIGRLDGLDQGAKHNLNNTSAAFGEIFSYMDKIKKDVDYQKEFIKSHEGDFPHGRPLYDIKGGDQNNPYLPRQDEIAGIGRKVDNFGTKLDRLKYADKDALAVSRPDNILGPRGGNESMDMPKDVRGHIDDIKKTVNTRLSKLESDFALIKSLRYGLQEGSGNDIVQNLLGAINNLTDRVEAIERGGVGAGGLGKGGLSDAFSLRPIGDLDLKIKVASLEKKFESLDIKASTGYALSKIPAEIEKVKTDFLALEARMSKDLSHVSEALRKGDFAIQSDLQRLMDMVTLMQKDIQDMQNYPVSTTGMPVERTSIASSYDVDLKKRVSALELKMDRNPSRSEVDLLVSRITHLEKSTANASLLRPSEDPYAQSSPTKLPGHSGASADLEKKTAELDKKTFDFEKKMTAMEIQVNMFKQELLNIKAQDHSPNKSSMAANKSDLSLDLERIERFVQEFVNKQALIKIKRIMQVNTQATQKMDKFEWIIRNLEFLSPNLPQNLLLWTQETILDPSVTNPNRDALTITKHTSEAVGGVVELIKGCLESQNPTLRELLDSYLAFLEVLLFSDINLEKAVYYGVVDVLFNVLDPQFKYTEDERRCALKCVLPCSRLSNATNIIFSSNKYLKVLGDMMSQPWDTDSLLILTNFFSKAFSEDNRFGSVEKESRDIINILFDNLVKHEKAGELVEETLQALMNLTRKQQFLDLIKDPKVFQKVIEIAKTTRQPSLKEYSTTILKNSSRKAAFSDYFKSQGFQ